MRREERQRHPARAIRPPARQPTANKEPHDAKQRAKPINTPTKQQTHKQTNTSQTPLPILPRIGEGGRGYEKKKGKKKTNKKNEKRKHKHKDHQRGAKQRGSFLFFVCLFFGAKTKQKKEKKTKRKQAKGINPPVARRRDPLH